MLVCQVATFSPICISMTLKECKVIDKQVITANLYRLKFMPSDAKHAIFLLNKKGGIRVCSFTHEYIGALLRDIEVFNSNNNNNNNLTVHTLISSIEEATKQCIWNFYQVGKIPSGSSAALRANQINISGKRTLYYHDTTESPIKESITYDNPYYMPSWICSERSQPRIMRKIYQRALNKG
jgi:hypothetical protein